MGVFCNASKPTKPQHRLRLRDLARFYCTAPTPIVPDSDNTQAQPTADDILQTFIPQTPRLAKDSQFTALAQLAAWKLRCQRSYISLIDATTQMVVAEATQSMSLFDLHDHHPGDEMVLGAQTLPLGYGICPHTLQIFLDDDLDAASRPSGAGSRYDKEMIVIPDLQSEPLTKNVPIMSNSVRKKLRYYLEVPLKSDAGFVIGSICVVDPRVRQITPDEDIKTLQEIAQLVVQHMQEIRMKQDYARTERLLQGLAHFVKGKDSLSEWSKQTKGQQVIPSTASNPTSLTADLLEQSKSSLSLSSTMSPWPSDTKGSSFASSTTVKSRSGAAPRSSSFASSTSTPPTPSVTDSREVSSNTDLAPSVPSSPAQIQDEGVALHTTSVPDVTRSAFSRASNLLRESMDLDVTCFLEVPQNDRYKNQNHGHRNGRKQSGAKDGQTGAETVAQDSTCSSYSESDVTGDSATESGAKAEILTTSEQVDQSPAKTLCHRLGYSTRFKSSLVGSAATDRYLSIPASLLSRLTAKYPAGHIFHFDEAGNVSSGDDVGNSSENSRQRQRQKKQIPDRLFNIFPGARSLIFLPLYDNDRQHVYAGFLGWTTDPTRALQRHEITYVAGFANSIMCEVMRVEAMAIDKAKSNFISSISHELRSPLHGILAATQLLQETDIRDPQDEFVEMIDTCARTLLDIMNHLLDHAKINQFTARSNNKKSRTLASAPRKSGESYSLVSNMNLALVVEETLAGLAASNSATVFSRKSSRETTSETPLSPQERDEPAMIPLIVDIAPRDNYVFSTEAGSWRRIVMNLVGNAIKYTQEGHISVALALRQQVAVDKASSCLIAELRISDTGQGISQTYLKHRLYTPFAQENNLSVGAGLGLSLVKQIVASLNGTINIQSEVGAGTDIVVKIPLEQAEPSPANPPFPYLPDSETLASLAGHNISFAGFDIQPSYHEHSTGILPSREKSLLALKRSLTAMAADWFGLRTKPNGVHIWIVEESSLGDQLPILDRSDNRLLIVGLDGHRNGTRRPRLAHYVHILPPVGPRSLAVALKKLMSRSDSTSMEGISAWSAPRSSKERFPTDEGYFPDYRTSNVTYDQAVETKSEAESSPNMGNRQQRPSLITTLDASQDKVQVKSANPKILLVDDNNINLRILVSCVNKLGNLPYVTASNGKEARDKYMAEVKSGERIALIFMDISMPVMDGIAATREIRAFERKHGLTTSGKGIKASSKIIALTGLASGEAQREVETCGFDRYLRKPVNLKVIREILTEEHMLEEPPSPNEK